MPEVATHTVVDARGLAQVRAALEAVRLEYKAQRAKLQSLPSGRSRGMAGYELAQIGKRGRKTKALLDAIERECLIRGVLV